ncbi:MAG: virulence factor Mce family protein [Marmoricola sp.]|jgi:phospholipid/cholesterol/gamma-HCH transport system substrate-binding protein|nr:virulence factor Mce family protein [Marmoricola sp.]
MRRSRRITALVLTLVGALFATTGCSIYDVSLPGGANVGSNPIKVHIMFRDVLDLVPQSTVKVDDVTVGKVSNIKLNGYIADVTVELPKTTDLPANSIAQIRQTSLLGEKFVSLSGPTSNPSSTKLGNGDVIPLSRTGRNPEVEEVLSALALLLNGGGVGQLKTIASELNNAVGGREADVRSVIDQIHSFMGQLDQSKASVVLALDNLNRLAVQLRKQDGSIRSALDNLPRAIKSINGQRDDLVKMLQSLSKLSSVGVQVISASKAATINSLQSLSPVLSEFAKAGQDLPDSLQVLLTYPFIDAAVGRDPQVARNLHMGDFVNLSIRLDLNLANGIPGLPGLPTLPAIPSINDLIKECEKTPLAAICKTLNDNVLQKLCALVPANPLCPGNGDDSGPNLPIPPISPPNLGGGLGGLLGGLGLGGLGLGRAPTAYQLPPQQQDPFGMAPYGYDPGVGTLLLQGVAANS